MTPRVSELGSGRVAALVSVGVVASMLASVLLVQSVVGGIATVLPTMGGNECEGENQQPSQLAEEGIPRNYLRLYKQAAQEYGVPWNVLAGIGRVETNHGRLDAQGVTSGENFAGAGGPMQFLEPTWDTYGVDGNGDGTVDRYDPADAIPAAANYLAASGAPADLWDAIFAYNHASWYVEDVLHWATRYANGGALAVAANFSETCAQEALGPVPEGQVGQVIAYAREQLDDPYVWGAEGPDAFDCSGLMLRAYQAIGVNIPRTSAAQFEWGPEVPEGQEQPGDLVFFDFSASRPGIDHVGLVIGDGRMLEAANPSDGIRIRSYRDSDPAGFTRPLEHAEVAADL